MIQRFLYTALTTGLEYVRDNPEVIDDVFSPYDLPDEEIAAIKTLMVDKFPTIKHQYARTDDDAPIISIVLTSESEGEHYIGDYAAQLDDGSEVVSSIWKHSYAFLIYTEHPDHSLYLYELVKSIMVSAPLSDCGLFDTHFSGGDITPDPRYIPEHLFARQFMMDTNREFEIIDRAAALSKAFRVGGIHVDKSGSPSDVGGVKTLVTVYSERITMARKKKAKPADFASVDTIELEEPKDDESEVSDGELLESKSAPPKKADPIPEKPPVVEEAPAEPAKPLVALRVFTTVSSLKWDQMAGFQYYAKSAKLGPMTIDDWRQAFQDFMERPIR